MSSLPPAELWLGATQPTRLVAFAGVLATSALSLALLRPFSMQAEGRLGAATALALVAGAAGLAWCVARTTQVPSRVSKHAILMVGLAELNELIVPAKILVLLTWLGCCGATWRLAGTALQARPVVSRSPIVPAVVALVLGIVALAAAHRCAHEPREVSWATAPAAPLSHFLSRAADRSRVICQLSGSQRI